MIEFHPSRIGLPPAAVAKLHELQNQSDFALRVSRMIAERLKEAQEDL